MKQDSIVTFWHPWGDIQSKSLEIWHIWTFEYVPWCEWCVLLTVKYYYFWQTFKFWLIKYFINVMREACLCNNWSFVPIFLKIYRALMRWTPWSFLGEGGGDESPRWGHSPRMRSGGSGDEGSLPNSFGWEFILFIRTHFYGGALTWHFMEKHSSPTSIFPVFMITSSNGNMLRVTGFCAGNSPVTAGNSPVKFGILLYPDYHSLKLTIFCTQWQFKFVVSDHPLISLELGRK